MMRQWPEFDGNGDLPAGIHQATLAEVIQHFGTSTLQRRIVAQRLQRIYRLARGTGHLARIVVFGSFVTAKPAPNDVDIFMVMEDAFDSNQVTGEAATLFDHTAAQHGEGASVFWIRRMAAMGGEQAALEYWQIKRDHTKRGIVEVVDDDTK
jgi:predicted nucleotidyltransferase